MLENARLAESSTLTADQAQHDAARWRCEWSVAKYDMAGLREIDPRALAVMTAEQQLAVLVNDGLAPFDVLDRVGNLLMFGGASALWHRLTGGTTVTVFSNANAHIGVGDSTTAAAATQTDLQAATNKAYKAMDATYPLHTDGTGDGADDVQFKATFGTGDANFAWQEWGIFNASTAGRMLNRKVESLGTKTSSASWAFTVTLSLA